MMTNVSDSSRPAVSNRVVTLEGGCNFRDIGGYETNDGCKVKWRHVFRAGVLSYFTPGDHSALHALGIRTICDLRRAEERQKEPTRWPDESAETLQWEESLGMPTLRSYAAMRANTAAGMSEAMIDLYRALPQRMAARLFGLFSCIADQKLPLLVHCAAGKDRTGFAVAALLAALNVPRETIVADYLITNETVNFEAFIRTRHTTQLGLADANHPLLQMPEDMRRVLFSARTEFIDAAFDQIRAQYGGLDNYLEDEVGMNAAMRERVRLALLD